MMMNCDICATFPGHQEWCPRAEGDKPSLGLATTRQLLEEIRARGETTNIFGIGEAMAGAASALLQDLPENALNYRTVDES